MSISYESTGRVKQKSRTRDALIAAARRLMDEGTLPTVEQAATAASISRPTAYRYFGNQRALLVAARPEVSKPSLLPDDASPDPAERLQKVAEQITGMIVGNEAALRAMLRISLEATAQREDLVMRTGRRIVWVQNALAPLEQRLDPKEFHSLVLRIATVLGIESLVWLTDIAHVSRDEAAALMQRSALDILKAVLCNL